LKKILKDKRVAAGIILFLLLFILVLLRGVIVESYISGKVESAEKRYALEINYDNLEINGIAGITLKGLSVCQTGHDTLISSDEISVRLNPLKLLFLKIDTRSLKIDKLALNFVKEDSTSNYEFLFKEGKSLDTTGRKTVARLNYSRHLDNLLSMIFGILPKNAQIQELSVVYKYDEYYLKVNVPDFKVDKDVFTAKIFTEECGHSEQLVLDGKLNDSKRNIAVKIYSGGEKRFFSMPFINFRWSATMQFDTLSLDFSSTERDNGVITIKGNSAVAGVAFYHEKVSPENVVLKNAHFNYKVNIGENYFELDSSSVFRINDLTFSPYFKAQKRDKWVLTASVNKSKFPAQQLFSSLPEGLFRNLEGIEVSGNIDYHFYLNIDFSNVDSLKIESLMRPDHFRIVKYGKTDLRRMNGEFEYTAYENGIPVRTFAVGPSNPNFRSLDQISPILQMAVMQSEDGGFFYHNGFLPEAIREALATNIKDKRFRRGGSTISMQLVKNVFLSRHKTLARKFEEMLIVWLIENNRLSSKQRMFEVYMNIIEWGPMVYGANEAARFYFNKDVRDLTVNESIFLAGIIPSPKRSLNNFTPDGQLIPERMDGYFRLLAGRLRVKGLITEAEEALIKPELRLSGESLRIIQQRAAVRDSIMWH